MDSLSRPELFDFHGVSMTHYFTDNWVNIQNFQARPDDILIASYPKAGNTWVSYILDLLCFGQTSPERQTSIPIYARVPNLEITFCPLQPGSGTFSTTHKGTEMLDRLPTSPRLIRTHLPVNFMPKSFWEQSCRIIYVGRNAKDSTVSYFHFERMMMIQPEPGDWSSYVQRFMQGKRKVGDWKNHFTVAQSEVFDEDYKKKMKDPTLHFRTSI